MRVYAAAGRYSGAKWPAPRMEAKLTCPPAHSMTKPPCTFRPVGDTPKGLQDCDIGSRSGLGVWAVDARWGEAGILLHDCMA